MRLASPLRTYVAGADRVELDLPGYYDEATGEPHFAVDVGESYQVSDVRLRFAARDGGRYLIEMSGIFSASVLGHPERFELVGAVTGHDSAALAEIVDRFGLRHAAVVAPSPEARRRPPR